MNIGIFTDTYPPLINGVSTSTYNLVQVLKKHGHNVVVVTPQTKPKGKLEIIDNVIYMPGIEVMKVYGYRLTKIYDRKVLNILKGYNLDLIHNQTDFGVGIFARFCAKSLKIPLVYTYHTSYEDYTYYVTHGFLDRFAKKTVRSYSKGIANSCTEFITPSMKTKDFMRSVGTDIYINVIPTGIDFSLFSDDKVDHNKERQFKKEHNIDDDTKIMLILGRIAKEKSMDVSIRGFAHYLKIHPEQKVKLIIVGGGPQKSELELLTHELKISQFVDFIGPVPASEVPFYYHLADIYTSASLTETQGLTFMEAMSSGTMVLARYDDNLSDTIIDGQTGFFFTDEESFVNKVNRIFSLSKEDLQKIKNNAYSIVDTYSIDKFYNNIIEVYNRAQKKYW